MAAALIAAASVTWAVMRTPPPAPIRAVTRSLSHLKDFSLFVNVSPDGTRLAYVSTSGNATVLVLRMLDQFEGKPIPGTEGGVFPVFSPDGQWIAYSSAVGASKIRKVPLTGGTSITICDGDLSSGGAWGADDTLVFSGSKGLMRVSAAAGTPQTLTTVDAAKGEASHVRPQFLPGGRQLLFTVLPVNTADGEQFAVLDLVKGGYTKIGKGGVNGKYAASGHLTFMRGSTIFAQPFDLGRLAVTGGEVPVIENASVNGPTGTGDYSFSDAGLLAYVFDEGSGRGTTVAWADRKGATTVLPGQSQKLWGTGRLSPDGRLMANPITDEKGSSDIWVLDVQRGVPSRVTFDASGEDPIWTPDSRTIIFSAALGGKRGLYSVAADASGKPALVLLTDTPATASSMTPDGKTLVFSQSGADKHSRIMLVDMAAPGGPAKPRPLHEASGAEGGAQVSPDGRLVAYISMESGTAEIYLQAYPGIGPKVRVSERGGYDTRWSRDGRELYYRTTASAQFVAVDVAASPAVHVGTPRDMFQLFGGTTWDVTPERNRFLVELTSAKGGSAYAIVTDWFEELRRRAPAKK